MNPDLIKVLKDIEKEYGEGTLTIASDPSLDIEKISTGVLPVDWLLKGGWATGRTIELFGQPGVGKTTLAYRTIAATQAAGGMCAFFDTEKTFHKPFAATLGVDLDNLIYNRQRSGNEVVTLADKLVRSKMVDVIVIDSIAALCTKKELESALDSTGYATQVSQLMSAALKKLTRSNSRTTIIFINQLRENLNAGLWGKKWVTTGGRAMAFYATTRLELAMTETIKKNREVVDADKGKTVKKDVAVGHRVIVRVEKDKSGSAKKGDMASFIFDYDATGIDNYESLVFVGRQLGVLKSSGNKLKAGSREFATKSAFKKYLEKNPSYTAKLEGVINQRIEEISRLGRQVPSEGKKRTVAKKRGSKSKEKGREVAAG